MKDYVDNFEPLFVDVASTLQAPTDEGLYARGGKRVFDLVLAVLLLPLIAPVVAALWLLVRRDGGPGFLVTSALATTARNSNAGKYVPW